VADLELDPTRSNFVTLVGKKGSGKSQLARMFWLSYPFDRLVIDPTGDVDAGDPDTHELRPPLPARWPTPEVDERGRRKRQTLRFMPDPGEPTYVDDMDRAVGLAHWHPDRRALLWIDEIDELTKAQFSPPHLRRALKQGRHRRLSLLCCGPRPVNIDPLVLAQADYVGVFRLPNPNDRRRVAETCGIEPDEFDHWHGELEEHGFLWYDQRADELTVCDPIPLGGRSSSRPRATEPLEMAGPGGSL
jgi:hypothetical protein